jgi:hypothetical protein
MRSARSGWSRASASSKPGEKFSNLRRLSGVHVLTVLSF